jgi:dTDP-4-dehydrorhamnose 3,5-epimerase
VEISELAISGSWLISHKKFDDSRGFFYESFKADVLENALKRKFSIAQANTSVSKKGAIRGIHYALVPPSQAKYVQCLKGEIRDFVIDVRTGSKTFGQHDFVDLSGENPQAIFIEEGLAHAFVALSDDAIVAYLVSAPYNPEREKAINPLDEQLNINWILPQVEISEKDQKAPSLSQAESLGFLPKFDDCKSFIKQLKI